MPGTQQKERIPAGGIPAGVIPAGAIPAEVPERLCAWYEAGHRDLPWRREPSPYHVWISEIMLQQTRVEAVKPYYERFIRELPDIASLAECREERLLKLWEGLGYYSRARNLKKTAMLVMTEYGGRLPAEAEALQKLPGIGPYTAGAIASIAFGREVPAVDGNVVRVITRCTADRRDIRLPKVAEDIRKALLPVMPKGKAGVFNQALMELGAMVCLPAGTPACADCPLAVCCAAYREGITGQIPYKSPPPKRRIERKTVLVLRDGRHTLLLRRDERGLLAGLYGLPMLEEYRSEKEVLEYLETELGITAYQIRPLPDAKHVFSHIEWRMKGYLIRTEDLGDWESRAKKAGIPAEHAWAERMAVVEPQKTRQEYPIPAAYRAYAAALQMKIGNEAMSGSDRLELNAAIRETDQKKIGTGGINRENTDSSNTML